MGRVTETLNIEECENEEVMDRVDQTEQNNTSGNISSGHVFDRSVTSPTDAPSFSKPIDVIFSDTDVMDCNICSEPLNIPIFQCINGHTICAECHSKMDTCAFCKVALTRYRSYAMERILKYIIIPCENAKYGCKEVVRYTEKREHQDSCMFQPCLCPQTGCNFLANSSVLGEHFKTNHQLRKPPFSYNEVFSTSISFDDSVTVLQAVMDDELFVITNKVGITANTVNLLHIGPNSRNPQFRFKMLIWPQEGGRFLRFDSKANNIQDCTYTASSSSSSSASRFFYVPLEYFLPTRRLNMQLCIYMTDDVHPGAN